MQAGMCHYLCVDTEINAQEPGSTSSLKLPENVSWVISSKQQLLIEKANRNTNKFNWIQCQGCLMEGIGPDLLLIQQEAGSQRGPT